MKLILYPGKTQLKWTCAAHEIRILPAKKSNEMQDRQSLKAASRNNVAIGRDWVFDRPIH